MRIPEAICLRPTSAEFGEQLSRLRRVSGIYLLSSNGAPLHLSWSANLERRLKRLLLSSYPASHPAAYPASTGANGRLGDKLTSVECWPTGSRLELNILLYHLAKKIHPQSYVKFLKMRLPWFVGLAGADAYPRLETINRLSGKYDALWGPFPARGAAQQYEQETLGLFQIRRCTEALTPHPEHPGCIYGEMNQCLRPCQATVSASEYGVEAKRVRDFLDTNGRGAIASLSSARERACEEAEFEQAAQIHKRIEKLKAAAALRDPVIRELKAFNGLALTRCLQPERFLLWPMLGGLWQNPIPLDLPDEGSRVKSLDTTMRELLAERLPVGAVEALHTEAERCEHLAIFSRWYYSSWRDGDWLPFGQITDLNYRKLVRGLSKMAQPALLPGR